MTNEQRESLARIRANYSSLEYSGFESGSYRTDDMDDVMDVIDELEQKLDCVKADLEDIRTSLQMNDLLDQVTLELVESTLMLLDDVES